MQVGYTEIGLTIVFAALFYSAAEVEARSTGRHLGALWASLSVLVSFVVLSQLGGSKLLLILMQAGLFIGIAVVRVLLEGRSGPRA